MGTNTDPYQRAEAKYRLTGGIVGALADSGTPFSILTKSGLVLRDLDLLRAAADRVEARVMFSIGTVDSAVWRAAEPGTPHPRRRLDAMRALASAGIKTGALVAPVLPGLSDSRASLSETVTAILDAGGTVIGSQPLYLRGATREYFLSWLREHDERLFQRYLTAYSDRVQLPSAYKDWVKQAIAEIQREYRLRRSSR